MRLGSAEPVRLLTKHPLHAPNDNWCLTLGTQTAVNEVMSDKNNTSSGASFHPFSQFIGGFLPFGLAHQIVRCILNDMTGHAMIIRQSFVVPTANIPCLSHHRSPALAVWPRDVSVNREQHV